MKATEKLHMIMRGGGRGCGKTEAMLKGAENVDCIVVCATHAQEQQLKQRAPKIETISLENLDRLRGLRVPIVIDHYALEILWQELEKERLSDEYAEKMKVGILHNNNKD